MSTNNSATTCWRTKWGDGAASVIDLVEATVSVDKGGSLLALGKRIQVVTGKDQAKAEG